MRPIFSFGKDIGIDLGTANTLVFMRGQGIILREPSVVAVDTRTDTVRYVGQEAKDVIGRTPGSIVAVRPLKDGVIADFDITANMLQIFIKKVTNSSFFSRPNVVVCIPSGVTAVERRAVREATIKAGARKVAIIEEPMGSRHRCRASGCRGHGQHGRGHRRRHQRGGCDLAGRHCIGPFGSGRRRQVRRFHHPVHQEEVLPAHR